MTLWIIYVVGFVVCSIVCAVVWTERFGTDIEDCILGSALGFVMAMIWPITLIILSTALIVKLTTKR